jgi:DNA gyrase/topoisomerase IV subunit A
MDVVEKVPNFDSTTQEPLVINTRIPLLLMNGCSGIAVGLSVDIPPHNLKEIVDALVLVAKNPKTVSTEDIANAMPGPDFRNGGTMLSKKADVVALYETGKGMLEFQCDYVVGKDEDGRTTINVIGFPDDAFALGGFITACETLREKGLIYSVEPDYIDSRYKEVAVDNKPIKTHSVRVTVSNRKGLDLVLKKLIVRKTYQYYTTKRTPDGIELKTYNMLEMMKQWIKWRKNEEQKVLTLDLSKAEKSLWNENTRLLAMQPKHIDIIADALKQNKLDFEVYLAKHLKVTAEQATFIADLKVGNLRKANIPEQEAKIKTIKAQIAKIKDDLEHITRVVIKHLRDLSTHFDERRTKISGKAKTASSIKFEHAGDPIVMMASTDGKLFTNVTDKGSTTASVMATASYEGSVIFNETGLTSVLSPTECDGKAGPAYKNIVGIAPADAQNILVIGKNGNCVKMPGADSHKQSEFNAIKNTSVIAGLGTQETSSVLVWGKKDGEFACIRASKIKETRKNTGGVKLIAFKPVKAMVVHEGQSIYTDEGTKLTATKAGDSADHKARVFVLDDRNIVIYKSGRRKFFDRATTVKEIAKDKSSIRFVYPVSPLKQGDAKG